MSEAPTTRRRCGCGHQLLRHRVLLVTICPSCDMLGLWPDFPKGTWRIV